MDNDPFESIRHHVASDWYNDAKLGIFITWGLFSVPGWAPKGNDIDKQVAEKGWEGMFANNPYAEWYMNTLRMGDTPTRRHHLETYGPGFGYDDFAPLFNQSIERWNPDEWASLFQKVGARYVVLVTKHHDGFLLWPSARTSPHKPGVYATRRDLVGELTDAVRRYGMRMGLYYSGGLDWSFNPTPIRGYMDVYSTIVQSQEFIDYANLHWHELIDRYAPSILWNDIGAPAGTNLPELFAYYYASVAEGVINDRWSQVMPGRIPAPGEMINPPPAKHCDFTTPEYAAYDQIMSKKWEATRGIGHSFSYNQNEGPDDYLSVTELVRSFVDIVSKNGNLLLDVGPKADGTIPELQRERLLGLGAWLDVNGDAIFGTRPWVTAGGHVQGTEVRYTQKDDALYAIVFDSSQVAQLTLANLIAAEGSKVELLGRAGELSWGQQGSNLVIDLPRIPVSPADTIRITPKPHYQGL